MQKTLNEMADFMQKLLPPEIPAEFEIDTMFHDISDIGSMRNGVRAFKDFMRKVYDRLKTDGGQFDKPRKEAHEFSDGVNISEAYPFINNIAVFLMNMGLHGVLAENNGTLLMNDMETFTAEGRTHLPKTNISDVRKIECMRFFTDCGMCFGGIDTDNKKPIQTSTPIVITYPESPVMLTGLKVMAAAQQIMTKRHISDILIRCDYRVLAGEETEILPLLKDLLHYMPADLHEFIIKLHTDYMSMGYKFETRISNNVIFTYFCRSKELWRFNISINNGHNITIKAKNTDKYPGLINKMPKRLQEKIAGGYGCGKKMGKTSSCDGGCRGFRIPLDAAFMEISGIVKEWIYSEVSCISTKKAEVVK
jgi:hypothetical protein